MDKNYIKKFLSDIGLRKKDTVYVSINLALVSLEYVNRSKKNLCNTLYNSITSTIGEKGNFFTPTYSYSFSSDNDLGIFDRKKTKSKLGIFSNYSLNKKEIIRSNDPMVSIAGVGPQAKKVLSFTKNKSYGINTFWDKFKRIDNSKILNIGMGNDWLPFIHQAEYCAKSKYRSDKVFNGFLIDKKIKKKFYWVYYARELNDSRILDTKKIARKIDNYKFFKQKKVGRFSCKILSYNKIFSTAVKIIKKNPKILY